jgi:endonuclease YncB( thermonuclease family)
MSIIRTLFLGFIAASTLASCSRKPALFVDIPPTARSAQVVVVEPDALVVDGRHVRLSNALTPHLVPRAHCWAEAVAARQARDAVRSLVAEAREVTVSPTGGVDEYNRSLSRVSLDGRDLGQALVDRGMAAPTRVLAFDWCAPLSTSLASGPPVAVLADAGS